jgi:hypothetical protein
MKSLQVSGNNCTQRQPQSLLNNWHCREANALMIKSQLLAVQAACDASIIPVCDLPTKPLC